MQPEFWWNTCQSFATSAYLVIISKYFIIMTTLIMPYVHNTTHLHSEKLFTIVTKLSLLPHIRSDNDKI